jgi:hypothetical protein
MSKKKERNERYADQIDGITTNVIDLVKDVAIDFLKRKVNKHVRKLKKKKKLTVIDYNLKGQIEDNSNFEE